MNIFYIFFGAVAVILLINFFYNSKEKDFITPKKQDKGQSFSELLNYTALVDDGIILTTEGTLIAGFFFQGDDTQAFTEQELEGRSVIINDTIKNLGENCVVQVDAIRTPANEYPTKEKRFFPDTVTANIDNIRRKIFQDGVHSETTYAFLVTYIPPKLREKKVTDLMYDTPDNVVEDSPFTKNLNIFKEKLYGLEERLRNVLRLNRMHSMFNENEFNQSDHTDELVNYINYCLSGQYISIKIPSTPIHITSLFGVEEFEPGLVSVLGNKNIITVSVNGYPIESTPAILNSLDKL